MPMTKSHSSLRRFCPVWRAGVVRHSQRLSLHRPTGVAARRLPSLETLPPEPFLAPVAATALP
eukprot:6202991-Pleurochrysis_carterae.AAC.4